MLEFAFTLILAGCGDAGGPCTVLERSQITAPSITVCEEVLDQRLLALDAPYPEFAGVCLPGDTVADLPEGWTVPEITVAGG